MYPTCTPILPTTRCHTDLVSALIKMAKLRKQLALDLRRRTHGGARKGAGRPKKIGQHDSPHRTRPRLRAYHPTHVVMRVKKGVPKLRQGRAYRAVRRAMVRCLGQEDFRICHLSIQGTHLHFLVEATDERSLSRGMQRLNILVSKALNRELGRNIARTKAASVRAGRISIRIRARSRSTGGRLEGTRCRRTTRRCPSQRRRPGCFASAGRNTA